MTGSSEESAETIRRLAARTFDGWAAEVGLREIDVVKIDVEGAELDVLEGMGRTFADHPPHYVICETPADGPARRHLEALGFRSSVIDPVPGGIPNLLFSREARPIPGKS